jgi:hypothetical protein
VSYQDKLIRLAGLSEAACVGLWREFAAGSVAEDVFTAALTALLSTYNGRAVSLAQLAFAAAAMAATGTEIPVDMLPVRDDTGRLIKAANTVTELAKAADEPEPLIGRLGRSEPLNTAGNTYSDLIAGSDLTEGWIRRTDPNACQLCQWWARDGRVCPKDPPKPQHNGCACVQEVVWDSNIRETQYTKARRESWDEALMEVEAS